MNREHRRPIFGFLWPQPDPNAPVDDAYEQVRLARVPSRGPLRIAILVAGTVGLTLLTGTALTAAIGTSWPGVNRYPLHGQHYRLEGWHHTGGMGC